MKAAYENISRCPRCGGRIIVGAYYSFSKNYKLRLDGKLPLKPYKRSEPGPMEVSTAWCENFPASCNVSWEADEFLYDDTDGFCDLKYCKEKT